MSESTSSRRMGGTGTPNHECKIIYAYQTRLDAPVRIDACMLLDWILLESAGIRPEYYKNFNTLHNIINARHTLHP